MHKNGPLAGLPDTSDTWVRGANISHGRMSTFESRSSQRWPRPEYYNPLMAKVEVLILRLSPKLSRFLMEDIFEIYS